MTWNDVFPGPYPRGMDPSANNKWKRTKNFTYPRDPLVLDLDGDGIETIALAAGLHFDHNADNIATGTGWLKGDDAFLVRDVNGNGVIDTGRELFGDNTLLPGGGTAANGFAALAALDTNADGFIDASDAAFAELKLWQDLNQDGISQTGELFTLASQNIVALKVAKTAHSQLLANGNQIADLGGYLRGDGSEHALGEVTGLGDINLASNPFYSEFTDHITLTDAAKGIASMQGAGMVRSLREAASLNGSLATQVAALATPISRTQMLAQIDGIIDTWADTSGMNTSIEAASDKGYLLKYLAPGMNANDILGVFNMDGGGGGTGELTEAERERRAGLQAQVVRLNHLIGVLERFNGSLFVTVGEDSVTTGTGLKFTETLSDPNPATLERSPYVFVPINAGQLTLLEQSYAQLKQSVYDGLVVQTRLKPYLDVAMNDSEWRMVA